MELERISLAIDGDLVQRFDRLVERSGAANRSEAIRDLIRRRLVEEEWKDDRRPVVGTLTLVYDHEKRELADKLLETGHEHHDEILATLHVHLDESRCLEVMALRGRPSRLREIADLLSGMKGVMHGQLVMSSEAL
ncbi:MAG: nickel-responsive transcriptional regulator NikR [Candidatus Polarisedimenticolia bacterium]|nr:nickel-responsive transcriptional regulator NikR [bacterium]